MAKKKILRASSALIKAQTKFFKDNFVVPLSLCGTVLLMKISKQNMDREEINADCGEDFTRDLIDTGLKENLANGYITQYGTSLNGGVKENMITDKGKTAAENANALNNIDMIKAGIAYRDEDGKLHLS